MLVGVEEQHKQGSKEALGMGTLSCIVAAAKSMHDSMYGVCVVCACSVFAVQYCSCVHSFLGKELQCPSTLFISFAFWFCLLFHVCSYLPLHTYTGAGSRYWHCCDACGCMPRV